MRPDVVTFWHGPLDRLRRLCLRSQVAVGHKVTVFSFEPLAGLPGGVGNADAAAILPHAFSERLRPPQPDGSWRDWTTLQFSDFFRMRLMAENAGLWLDADVLLLKPVEIDLTKPFFAWERPRQLGNSVLCLPSNDAIVTAFEALMAQDELTPDWLSLRHRLTFALRKLRGGSNRLSDIRVAIYGPAALTALARRAGELGYALPKKSFYAVHADPKLFFEPSDHAALIGDPGIIGLHISPKGRGSQPPVPGSLHAWAAQRFCDSP
jgi:Capsular polysaccharide synthesis protein